jgi:hypothetical protein
MPQVALTMTEAHAILAERERRRLRQAKRAVDLEAGLTAPQLAVYRDPRKRLSVLTGRRAGKTYLASRWLLARLGSGETSIYVSTTARQARRQMWPELRALVQRMGGKINETEMTARLISGGLVVCGGCDDREQVERWRGEVKVRRAWVDECGAWPSSLLEVFVEQVLEPASLDIDADIVMSGTPGPTLRGYWYDATGAREPDHRWTAWDNTAIGDAGARADRIRMERGWSESHPTWVREYLGRWVRDEGALVYPYAPERDGYDVLPHATGWRWLIGVDVGVVDATAIVVIGVHPWSPAVWCVSAESHSGWITGQVAQRIRELQREHIGAEVVLDAGGMGRLHAEELSRRFGISITPAVKTEKASAIRTLRDSMIGGAVRVRNGPACDALRDEWAVLGWDDDRQQHAPNAVDHASDAFLYAFRAAQHYSAAARREQAPKDDGAAEYERRLRQLERGDRGRQRWDR